MAVRVGVILSGSGYLDGTEITEAVSILVALDRRGAAVTCLAPDMAQTSVINHQTRKPCSPPQTRNVLEESARIARGNVRDIASANADDFDALVFPGGFGAAKNLSNFATEGSRAMVHADVARLIREMHEAGKPMGFACIAPVLAAAVLGAHHPRLTIGTDRDTAHAMGAMGAVHQDTGPTDICIDSENRLVSTPCYMNDVGPWTVYQGAEAMVEEVVRLTGDTASLIRREMARMPSAPIPK